MYIRSFCVQYNITLKTVQLFVFEVLMFHKNTYLLPPGEYSYLSYGNYDPTEGITLLIVGKYCRNKLVWVEVANEY